jgi:hypothetical protein
MLSAMIGSTTASGAWTQPAAARARVSECARVKAVTWVMTGRQERLSRNNPSTKDVVEAVGQDVHEAAARRN